MSPPFKFPFKFTPGQAWPAGRGAFSLSARAVLHHPRPHRPSAHCAHQRTPTSMQAILHQHAYQHYQHQHLHPHPHPHCPTPHTQHVDHSAAASACAALVHSHRAGTRVRARAAPAHAAASSHFSSLLFMHRLVQVQVQGGSSPKR